MKTNLLRIFLLFALTFSALTPVTTARAAGVGCFWNGSVDANWSTPGNWDTGCTGAGGIPGTGDTLTFPLGAGNAAMNNDLPAITLVGLAFPAAQDYTLNGANPISLTSGIDVQAGNQIINAPLTVAGASVTFHTANGAMLTFGGALDLDAYNVTFAVDSATDVIGINILGAINTSGLAKISKSGTGELKIIGNHSSKNFDIDINTGSISTDPSNPTYLPQYKTITLASGANLYLKKYGGIGSISGSGNIHASSFFQIRQGKNTTFTGDIFGNYQMAIIGNGTAVLTIDRSGGSLSYAGEINVNVSAKLLLANTTATASIPGFLVAQGRLELNNSHVGAIRLGFSSGGSDYNGALVLSGTNASTATSIILKNASSIETVINSATDYGHITVTSPVDLGTGAPLFVLQGSYTPAPGEVFTVIQNTNSGTATQTNAAFSNLPQGGVLPFNTINMAADYLAAGNTAFTLTATTPDVTPPNVQSSVRALSNPTSGLSIAFIVTFSENVTGVDIADFSVAATGISGASVGSVIPTSASVYIVHVLTGTGNGTLRLDIPAGATISDVASNPLAGLPYTSGETYDVQKDIVPPTTLSINRANPDPTALSSVDFTVTFSESVTGVDAADFTATMGGGVSGATVSGVAGSGSVYTLTVNTGSGNGTIRLDLKASGTGIVDALNNPISGGFTGGETYTVQKDIVAPTVLSIVRVNPNPTALASVNFTVTFSESVMGVDAADFALTVSGVSGATVGGVSGSGVTRTVNVNTGSGNGTIRLDLKSSGTGIVDALSNPIASGFTGGETYTVQKDIVAPTVVSIVRANPNPTALASVNFTVTFSESVMGVDAADFALTVSGVSGATVSGVSGSGATRTVSVQTGSGNGTIRLDLKSSGTGIVDALSNPISGGFTSGQVYTVNKTQTLILRSVQAQDGWILESGENTNKGGTFNHTTAFFRVGDDAARKQYRGILSFASGAALPDNAILTKVTLKVRQKSVVGGGNPVRFFQGFVVDLRKGTFGTSALQASDFQAAANKSFGPVKPSLVGGWYSFNLTSAKAYINKLAAGNGLTQMRLRFNLDDNNNAVANYLNLYGDSVNAANQPQLIVEYYIP